jgi:hypothetical protein
LGINAHFYYREHSGKYDFRFLLIATHIEVSVRESELGRDCIPDKFKGLTNVN